MCAHEEVCAGNIAKTWKKSTLLLCTTSQTIYNTITTTAITSHTTTASTAATSYTSTSTASTAATSYTSTSTTSTAATSYTSTTTTSTAATSYTSTTTTSTAATSYTSTTTTSTAATSYTTTSVISTLTFNNSGPPAINTTQTTPVFLKGKILACCVHTWIKKKMCFCQCLITNFFSGQNFFSTLKICSFSPFFSKFWVDLKKKSFLKSINFLIVNYFVTSMYCERGIMEKVHFFFVLHCQLLFMTMTWILSILCALQSSASYNMKIDLFTDTASYNPVRLMVRKIR